MFPQLINAVFFQIQTIKVIIITDTYVLVAGLVTLSSIKIGVLAIRRHGHSGKETWCHGIAVKSQGVPLVRTHIVTDKSIEITAVAISSEKEKTPGLPAEQSTMMV